MGCSNRNESAFCRTIGLNRGTTIIKSLKTHYKKLKELEGRANGWHRVAWGNDWNRAGRILAEIASEATLCISEARQKVQVMSERRIFNSTERAIMYVLAELKDGETITARGIAKQVKRFGGTAGESLICKVYLPALERYKYIGHSVSGGKPWAITELGREVIRWWD